MRDLNYKTFVYIESCAVSRRWISRRLGRWKKREKTPWTNFRKKHGPKKKENGEYLFDEKQEEGTWK